MGSHVASQLISAMKNKNIKIKKAKILIMGLTFKENCTDIRNSGVKNLFDTLRNFNCNLDIYDPWANRQDVKKIFNLYPIKALGKSTYDGIVIAVAHDIFKNLEKKIINRISKKNSVIYDLKNLFKSDKIDLKL